MGNNKSKSKRKGTNILVAGSSQSGKSTFFKQVQYIQFNSFSEEDKKDVFTILKSNIIVGFKEMIELPKYKFSSSDSIEYFKSKNPFDEFDNETMKHAKNVWSNKTIKKIWRNRHTISTLSILHLDYCMKHLDRIYKSTELIHEDVLLARKRTTGNNTISFIHKEVEFKFIDVGGQRSERRHWDQTVQNPNAIIFFASLIDWNLETPGGKLSKLEESLLIWEDVLANDNFSNAIFILILNKIDLLKEKIKRINFNETYPEFKGDSKNDRDVTDYIKDLFLEKAANKKETIQVHVTCALDTDQIKTVVSSIQAGILEKSIVAIL